MSLEHSKFGLSFPDRGSGGGSGGAEEQDPGKPSAARTLEGWRELDTQTEDLTRDDAKAIVREFFDTDWVEEYGSLKGFFPTSDKISELKDRYPGVQNEVLEELLGVDINEYKGGMFKELHWKKNTPDSNVTS